MKTKGIEIQIPYWRLGTARGDLHKSVDMFIQYGIPSYIREKRGFLSTTFKVYYAPKTWGELHIVSQWEKMIQEEVSRLHGDINA
jgi:hypothetical protein